MSVLKVAAAQFENRNGDKAYNIATIRKLTLKAAGEGADLISFHEGCIPGYSFLRKLKKEELFAIAEPVPDGDSIEKLIAISDESGLPIFAGLIELGDDGKAYNTYVCVYQGSLVAKFRKLHPFINQHLSPGSEYCVFKLLDWKIGMLICYDCHLPENARITALMGAEIIMMPNVTACLPGSDPGEGFVERTLWDNRDNDPVTIKREFLGPKGKGLLLKWLPARAYENGVYLVFSNPIGIDDDQIRNGNAMVLDPNGNIIAETNKLSDDIAIAPCNHKLVQSSLAHQCFLPARRPDLYNELTRAASDQPITRVPWML